MHFTSFLLATGLYTLATALAMPQPIPLDNPDDKPSSGHPHIRLSWDVNQAGIAHDLEQFTYESCNGLPIDKPPYLGK